MAEIEKLTVVPLHWCDVPDENQPKIDLGFGFSIERLRKFLDSADLGVWKWKGSREPDEIDRWDLCLVHRYESSEVIGEMEQKSITQLGYILGHLRLINPHRDSTDDCIQLSRQADRSFSGFSCSKANFRPNRFLTDCENLCCSVNAGHIATLKQWMPWIIEFAANWRDFYPFYLSLFFLEKGCVDTDFRTRHLFRVMSLEALLSSDGDFGRKAFKSKLPKLLGWHTDLYKPYSVDFFPLPELLLTDLLLDDIYTLRNRIAHADVLPEQWISEIKRPGLNEPISYAAQLTEAAASMARLSWLRILSENLQKTFANKKSMETFFRN